MADQFDYSTMQWGSSPMMSGDDFLRSLMAYGDRSAPLSRPMYTTTPALASGAAPLAAAPAASADGGSWWDGFAGKRNADGSQTMGWGSPALTGVQTLANLWLGMKNYNLAKDQLAFSKDSFAKNWGAQVSTTNRSLEDRQASRVAADPTKYESVSSYMAKHGIKV